MLRLKRSASGSTSSNSTGEDIEDVDVPDLIVVTDLLDLHGTPIDVIPEMLHDFLDNAVEQNYARVQIVHGKGKSRLKHLVISILKTDKRVARFYDAPPQFGGWGRTIAEIRRN